MRFELKRLQRELRITTVYVTHDQSEALALSHSIAVMNEGHIQQIGTPREIYERRADLLDIDRKSTRLNSSHGYISYAVFCLKKKKNTATRRITCAAMLTACDAS